jgi:hypothetical protein
MEPLNLTLGQQFEIERFNRAIDDCNDVEELRGIARQLLQAWQTQKAATVWMMKQNLSSPPRVTSLETGTPPLVED